MRQSLLDQLPLLPVLVGFSSLVSLAGCRHPHGPIAPECNPNRRRSATGGCLAAEGLSNWTFSGDSDRTRSERAAGGRR